MSLYPSLLRSIRTGGARLVLAAALFGTHQRAVAMEPDGVGEVASPHEPGRTPALPDELRPRVPLGTGGAFRPTLLAQLRTELDHPLHDGEETTATARLATLWVGAALSLAGDRLRLQGRVNLAPGHLELVDVYADVVASGQATLRAGIAKIPFTRA